MGMTWTQADGDAYHARNACAQHNWDPVLPVFQTLPQQIHILEIGCGNGWRKYLQFTPVAYTGIDTSTAALQEAREWWYLNRRYGRDAAHFEHGNAEELLSCGMSEYDLLVASYALHWLDNPETFMSRVAESGVRHVIINDFDPVGPIDVPYAHRQGLLTKKRPWPKTMTGLGYEALVDLSYRYNLETDGEPCRCTLWRRKP